MTGGLRAPGRWLAGLRIGVGLWFLKTVHTKLAVTLLGGVLPVPGASGRWRHFLPVRLHQFATGEPLALYRRFLLEVAIPHAPVLAQLTAFGEACVGVGLTLGLRTRESAGVAALLVLNYGLASFWQSPNELGFHLLLLLTLACIAGANAGAVWGLDGAIARRLRGRAASLRLLSRLRRPRQAGRAALQGEGVHGAG